MDAGTQGYVAPEVRAGRMCSHKVDVWSAGVLVASQVPPTHPFQLS